MSRMPVPRPLLLALVALAPFSLPAGASPAVGRAPTAQNERRAQPVACWWRHGVRHCNGYVYRRYGRGYGYYGYPAYYRGYYGPRWHGYYGRGWHGGYRGGWHGRGHWR